MVTDACQGNIRSGQSAKGFSLVELLVVIAVIAVVAAIAISNVANTQAAARQSAIDLQEKNLNSIYRSLKAASSSMPTTKEGILAVLATNSQMNFVPPDTMEGPEGTLTLTYDASADAFAYGNAPVGGGSGNSDVPPPADPTPSVSGWNPPDDAFVSNNTGLRENGGSEAWFNYASNPGTAAGGENYYVPQEGGYQFDPFRISVSGDGSTATLTTQSGQTYDMDLSTPGVYPFIQNGNEQIHWGMRNGGISVSSVVYFPQ